MPQIAFRLKKGSKDGNAGWLKATFVSDIARYFSTLTDDTSRVSCTGINLGEKNEITISTTSVVAEPQQTAEVIVNWINRNPILFDYDFKITVNCYDTDNNKVSVST